MYIGYSFLELLTKHDYVLILGFIFSFLAYLIHLFVERKKKKKYFYFKITFIGLTASFFFMFSMLTIDKLKIEERHVKREFTELYEKHGKENIVKISAFLENNSSDKVFFISNNVNLKDDEAYYYYLIKNDDTSKIIKSHKENKELNLFLLRSEYISLNDLKENIYK